VTIERQATTQDAIGQQTNTWSTLASRHAKVEPRGGSEFYARSGEVSDIECRMRLRFDADTRRMRTDDRIVQTDCSPRRIYNIRSIVNVDFANRELVVELSKFMP
jgi:SPP1 family predicted phage head-tail adaptor